MATAATEMILETRGCHRGLYLALLLGLLPSLALADETPTSRAHYLANAGVMIEYGDTKILFDPLFSNDYDQYDSVPPDMEAALFSGSAPWDGIDAVFVSHHHEDHFDPALMLQFLNAHADIELYAPQQAVAALRATAGVASDAVFERVHSIALQTGDAASNFTTGELLIEAIRLPHSGWPDRHSDIENIVFRVTLDDATTVMHFGDVAARDEHYAQYADHWNRRHTDLALPPAWLLLTPHGRRVLTERIRATHAIGIHVYSRIPDDAEDRPAEYRGVDLFTRPGETRDISSAR